MTIGIEIELKLDILHNFTCSNGSSKLVGVGMIDVVEQHSEENKFALLWGEAQLCLPYGC